MCECNDLCDYWSDIATFLLISLTEYFTLSDTFTKSYIFLIRIIFGFLLDAGALIHAGVKYGFDFKKENSNEYNPLPLVGFIVFILLWTGFSCLLFWYVIKHRKDDEKEIKNNNKYRALLVLSKCIGCYARPFYYLWM